MLVFAGLKVLRPINNKQRYRQALQQIKHYLSFKQTLEIQQSQYVLQILNGQYLFSLVKNPLYLHTNYFNMPIVQEEDLQFLDTCYECLMIVQEAFPSSIKLQIITDSQSKEIQAFKQRKDQEFNRRINSHLKTITDHKRQLTTEDIEDIIYLTANHYTRKNKQLALKLLLNEVKPANLYDLPEQYMDYLDKLQLEGDLKKLTSSLTAKMRKIQLQSQSNNENIMKFINTNCQRYNQPIKLQPLIFQLKESFKLERVCALLTNVLNTQHDKEYLTKLQPSVKLIENRFVSGQYDEQVIYRTDLYNTVKQYWQKRGKKWQEQSKYNLEAKVKELTSHQRQSTNKSKLQTSRRLNSQQ